MSKVLASLPGKDYHETSILNSGEWQYKERLKVLERDER